MEKGSDIGGVFSRLSRGAAAIEKAAKFAHDDHLGYITSCPTNCGTALRASVHIKLPYLMKSRAEFDAIAAKYFVQIRGIHGEHTETDDGVFDISNRRRLGRSEAQLVQDMYDGVKAMMEAEKALVKAAPAAPAKAADPKAAPAGAPVAAPAGAPVAAPAAPAKAADPKAAAPAAPAKAADPKAAAPAAPAKAADPKAAAPAAPAKAPAPAAPAAPAKK